MTHDRGPPQGSAANPHAFVCVDSRTCWIKKMAHQGLLADLIAGRLAGNLGVGPSARITRIPENALPADGSANHLGGEGVLVGTEDLPGYENLRTLHLIGVSTLDPAKVRTDDRALVVAFHTWLGIHDTQLMIHLQTGELRSIDHGEAFQGFVAGSDPALIVLPIPGVPDNHGSDRALVAAAVRKVESVSDDDLLVAAARVPGGGDWRAPVKRRLEIAKNSPNGATR